MDTVLYALGVLSLAAGVAGLVLPVIPGAALLVAGVALLAWASHLAVLGWGSIGLAVAVAVLIIAVDVGASVLGARAFGASRWALVGSGIGLVVGLFLGLPGIVLGPVIGAVVLEYARNPDFARAARAGVGTFVGFLAGSALKVSLGVLLVGWVALRFLFH
jgi:uncharacterized protein YqgC (DUF456 family)